MERNETFFEGPPCSPPYDGPSRAAFCAYEIALGYPKSLFRRAPWPVARGLEAHERAYYTRRHSVHCEKRSSAERNNVTRAPCSPSACLLCL